MRTQFLEADHHHDAERGDRQRGRVDRVEDTPQSFDLGDQRTRFVLEHWNNVSTSVREEALEAVRAGWLNWIEQRDIQALSKQIANPAGRLAITLEIAKLSSLSGLAGR